MLTGTQALKIHSVAKGEIFVSTRVWTLSVQPPISSQSSQIHQCRPWYRLLNTFPSPIISTAVYNVQTIKHICANRNRYDQKGEYHSLNWFIDIINSSVNSLNLRQKHTCNPIAIRPVIRISYPWDNTCVIVLQMLFCHTVFDFVRNKFYPK